MPRSVTHADLVGAFEHAEQRARARARTNVVTDLRDWRNTYGSARNRIETLYGLLAHHAGSEISATRIRDYVRSLFSGSIRPDIGGGLCNTATVRAGVWPGSGSLPTIVVGSADYMNHAGLGDSAILKELSDGDVDTAGEIKPGRDSLYLNRWFWGDESVGSYMDASQVLALVEFYGPALAYLGLHVDTDNDGRHAPVVGHRETTGRKVDPARVDLAQLRAMFEAYWAEEYGIDLPGDRVVDPLVAAQPLPQDGDQLVVDGILGRATISALQKRVGARVDGIIGPDTRRAVQRWLGVTVDGIWGRRTVRALQGRVGVREDGIWGRDTTRGLQRYLNGDVPTNSAAPAKQQLVVDGILGVATIRALQQWVGANVDGIWGPATTRALQAKVGARVDGVRGPETTRKTQAIVGATVDGIWGPATTRHLQTHLNTL